MFPIQLFYALIVVVIAGWILLTISWQIPTFKSAMEKGVHVGFERILIFCALIVIVMGVWFNGYKEGVKECQKQE